MKINGSNSHLLATKASNNIKTLLLLSGMALVVIFLGYSMTVATGNGGYLMGAVIGSVLMNIISYFFSASIALSQSGAVEADPNKYPDYFESIAALSNDYDLPKPKLYVINDPAPNAFATGRNAKHASVAVTTGLLAMLNKGEIEGVLAHELTHIKNKDMLIMSVVVIMSGVLAMFAHIGLSGITSNRDNRDSSSNSGLSIFIGLIASIVLPMAAAIVQMMISRKREFMADAGSGLLTGHPEALASALAKISGYTQPLQRASETTAHLYIACPFGGDIAAQTFFQKLFMTHPPVEERIKALLNQ